MVIFELDAALGATIREDASETDASPGSMANAILRQPFIQQRTTPVPRDDWERGLLAIARDCGVSLPNSALTREEMYD